MNAPGLVLIVVASFGALACGKDPDKQTEAIAAASASTASLTRVTGSPVARGSLRSPFVAAPYVLVVPAGSDANAVRDAVAKTLTERGYRIDATNPGARDFHAMLTLGVPFDGSVPDQALDTFARGLDDADRAGIKAAKDAVMLMLVGPADENARVQRDGAAIARMHVGTGWIVDDASQEVFTPRSFASRRREELPTDIRNFTTMQMIADENPGQVFFESSGLERLGLPELYIGDVPSPFESQVSGVFNAAAQQLVEQGGLTKDGLLEIDLSTITDAGWKGIADEVKSAGGTGRLAMLAKWSKGCGQHENMIALELPTGGDALPLREALLRFGGEWLAQPIQAPADEELLAASARAKRAFAPLADRCMAGLPNGESLRVKAPFDIDGNTEFMWVDLQQCTADTVSGMLINEPNGKSDLHVGSKVEVARADVYDYAYVRADGTSEGEETTKILMRRQ
ncbi:MAG TPA: DUF2314 domain-containing protein [Nannocystaceae bacterium]|nr:DUF2314 domain-containing protein [Nannocystaceae bacterium]